MISLKTARNFHGHLGPWLVLGLLMGEYGIKKISARKFFGLEVKVSGLNKKPRSCLIDGLQLSTGATLGKGNIKVNGLKIILVKFMNQKNKKSIAVSLRPEILKDLEKNMSHREAELMAARIYKMKPEELFSKIRS